MAALGALFVPLGLLQLRTAGYCLVAERRLFDVASLIAEHGV